MEERALGQSLNRPKRAWGIADFCYFREIWVVDIEKFQEE